MVWYQLGISGEQAALVVVSTITLYLGLILLVRLLGQRTLANMSSFDLGCVIATGAVVGRTALLVRPTLLAGVIAMTTLFLVQTTLARARRKRWIDRWMNRPPVLLMVGRHPLPDALRAGHVAEDELRQSLRLAGIRNLAEVRCVVLERNGAVSVIRQSDPIDSWLYIDVPGITELVDAPPDQRP